MPFRADTIAACASAIGAIASAIAATYALVFLSHQEEIARTQLQATYLSNLFDKQVDSLASLQATTAEFSELVNHDQLVGIQNIDYDHARAGVINTYYKTLKDQYSKYDNMIYTMDAKTEAVFLVVPESLLRIVQIPLNTSSKIASAVKEFTKGEPTKETFNAFAADVSKNLDALAQWQDLYLNCFRDILAGGKPMTANNVACAGSS